LKVSPSTVNVFAHFIYKFLQIVQLLIKTNKVDLTAHDFYAIRAAERGGFHRIVKALMENGRCVIDPVVDGFYFDYVWRIFGYRLW
jgi:hypothetical protein